jgi:hypothetical protein
MAEKCHAMKEKARKIVSILYGAERTNVNVIGSLISLL